MDKPRSTSNLSVILALLGLTASIAGLFYVAFLASDQSISRTLIELAISLAGGAIGFLLAFSFAMLLKRRFVTSLEKLGYALDRRITSLTAPWFNKRGVTRFYLDKTKDNFKNASPLFKHLESVVEGNEIVEARMAFGELGHRLMEDSRLPELIQYAVDTYGAKVEIVHGPRVDPKTKRIFDLAKSGKVKLFMGPKYKRHHFIIFTTKDGTSFIIDEAVHSETIWKRNNGQEVTEKYISKANTYYLLENANHYGDYLKLEFDRRKNNPKTEPITEHPGNPKPERFPELKFFLHTLSGRGVFAKYISQPLAILRDRPIIYAPGVVIRKWLNK
jgi:hypothetical protein